MADYALVCEAGDFGLSETLCYRSHIQIYSLPLEFWETKL
uniref:Zinc finger protein MAGPIE n=1 Tax=Rhizophora mucronata TaxID=61149 RepID=A0A2P2JAJ2_RHIMU